MPIGPQKGPIGWGLPGIICVISSFLFSPVVGLKVTWGVPGPSKALVNKSSKTGSNRAQNTANILGDFCVFPCFFNVLIGIYGVLIIPKLLKIDS